MDRLLATPYASGRLCLGADAGGDEAEAPRPGGLELTRRAIDCGGFAPGERILDLGCGTGAGSRLLRRRGCQPLALDRAVASLDVAARRLPGLAAVAADAARLPLADATVDGILAECSLSLSGYAVPVLGECRRVMRPGARLAITDVYAREPAAEPAPDASSCACLTKLSGRDAILGALAEAGFRIERWEDHSAVLKSFLAQLIFACGSADTLWAGDARLGETLRRQRPGYFLLIAAPAAGSTDHV